MQTEVGGQTVYQNTLPKGMASDPQLRLLDLQRGGYSLPHRLTGTGAGLFHLTIDFCEIFIRFATFSWESPLCSRQARGRLLPSMVPQPDVGGGTNRPPVFFIQA
jgi:hypothetical protein